MWTLFADFVLRFRIPLLILVLLWGLGMGFIGRKAELTYDFVKVVPEDDPEMVYFRQFNKTFGEDGNLFVIGFDDPKIYQLSYFRQFDQLSRQIADMEGIKEVISLPRILAMTKNAEEKRFDLKPVFQPFPADQQTLDSLLAYTRSLRFYEHRLFQPNGQATIMLVSVDDKWLNSKKRLDLMNRVVALSEQFSQDLQIKAHYAGLPFVRTNMSQKVKDELVLFAALSIGVTALVLLALYRSFATVFFPMLIIVIVILSTMGTLVLLGYKITILTGLLPSILVVIGIPNCVYMITLYHQECLRKGDKRLAWHAVIKKIGSVTFLTNATTAVGFLSLLFTNISILREFGLVASINIFVTFVISLIVIPSVFSLLPLPKERHTKHLQFKPLQKFIHLLDHLTAQRRGWVYGTVLLLVALCLYGMTRIQTVAFMVDDLPENSSIKKDLAWFEEHFRGVMPLEIVVDTGRKKGVRLRENLEKIDELEIFLSEFGEITPPVSMLSLLKAANQAYFDDSSKYVLPSSREAPFILSYLKNQADSNSNYLSTLVDKDQQLFRISMKVADLGSIRMDTLVSRIRPKVAEIFADTDLKVHITGTTLLFIKSNQYLIGNLKSSMMLAFAMIALIMGGLFRQFRMVLISLIPNIIPLIITAGLMGFLGIPLKPSTAIVFSIAFGISVDDSIHFLAKYRQELWQHDFDVIRAVSSALRETGTSMVYTSLILFFGFVIFTGSDFGGTVYLGLLTSITLLVAMLTNLVLLPSLLLSFDQYRKKPLKKA